MSEMAMTGTGSRPPGADGHDESQEFRGTLPMEHILSIENVAETFGISRWLLRYCEFRGLIKRRNRIGATWAYSWADCDRIAFLIKCRRAGLQFGEIAAVLRAADDDSARVHEAGQELCKALSGKLEARRKAIDEALSELGHTHSLLCAKLGGDCTAER
jgi:DNA-binding transcriptional MerR regulator